MQLPDDLSGEEMTLLVDCSPHLSVRNDDDDAISEESDEAEPMLRSMRRWEHMDNMDDFFRRVYDFHQRGGLLCICVEEFFSIFQFVFVICFSVFLIRCVDYRILFATPSYGNITHLAEAVVPPKQCIANFPAIIALLLLMSSTFLVCYIVKIASRIVGFLKTDKFYKNALRIEPSKLGNLRWNEVMDNVVDMSRGMSLCEEKDQLDHFDICSRMLRYKNYLIALINKDLIPTAYNVPLLGKYVYFPKYYSQYLEWFFFHSPWSFFGNYWLLNTEIKEFSKRMEVSNKVSNRILWLGVITLLFSPILFFWQLFLSFFKYMSLLKREPGQFSARRWSQYARYFLRDYNELPHILARRLNAAHHAASEYMNMFISPILIILCKNIVFITGALLASLIALSMIDEDVIRIEGVFQGIAWLTLIVGVVSKLIPDENAVYDVTRTFNYILSHIHYCPDNWRGNEHKSDVRNEFSNLFQMKIVYCLEELLSPFIIPLILIFRLRPRTLKIIDFFRNFTRYVDGVGDICSLDDLKSHGDPRWMISSNRDEDLRTMSEIDIGRHGKTEISLINFSTNYPEWQPNQHESRFIEQFHSRATQGLGARLPTIEASTIQNQGTLTTQPTGGSVVQQVMPTLTQDVGSHLKGAVAKLPPRPRDTSKSPPQKSLSDQGTLPTLQPLAVPPPLPEYLVSGPWLQTSPAAGVDDAGLRTLYMHELHAQRLREENPDPSAQQPSSGTTSDSFEKC